MPKGESLQTFNKLKSKLAKIWGLGELKVIPIGEGYFHVNLPTMSQQSLIMSLGTISLKPGVFRLSQWSGEFNPTVQHQINVQVWL